MNLRKLEGRQPFYDARNKPAVSLVEKPDWRGPQQYLEEAIRTHCSDLTLEFLQTKTGHEFVTAIELHHELHGYEIEWRNCTDTGCIQDGLAWTEIALAAMAKMEAE